MGRELLMRRPACVVVLFALSAGLAVACGTSANPTTPTSTGGSDVFTAFINNVMFSAPAVGIVATATTTVSGRVAISATSGTGATLTSVTLTLGSLSGPGTYPLGVDPSTTPGGMVQLLVGVGGAISSFTTPESGTAGSLTITALTGTAIAGTFQATVPATLPETGTTRTVAGGTFNVPITGGFVPATSASRGDAIRARR